MSKKYQSPLKISSSEWLEMLNNQAVFKEEDLQLIKILLDNGKQISASQVASEMGKGSYNFLNSQVGRLGKRIKAFLPGVSYPLNDKGETRYWHIPFLGEDRPDINRYFWELRPELRDAAKIYFYSDSRSAEESAVMLPEVIPAIRLLPMSGEDLTFTGKSLDEVQEWFKIHLPGERYQFRRKMNAPEGSLVLFQFQGRLIASALLEETVIYDEENAYGFNGYYLFSTSSIAIFDPLNFKDVQNIWTGMKSFNQSFQSLDPANLDSLKKLLAKHHFRFVGYMNDEEFQKVTEGIEVEPTPVVDEPKQLIEKVIKASERMAWRRDPVIAKSAIAQTGYRCEVNNEHEFFTSATTGKNYVEAHHLIPLEFQYEFHNSLDVESNIVSLCAMCHKKIHHAMEGEKTPLIELLHKQRSDRLKKCGIEISDETLKGYY